MRFFPFLLLAFLSLFALSLIGCEDSEKEESENLDACPSDFCGEFIERNLSSGWLETEGQSLYRSFPNETNCGQKYPTYDAFPFCQGNTLYSCQRNPRRDDDLMEEGTCADFEGECYYCPDEHSCRNELYYGLEYYLSEQAIPFDEMEFPIEFDGALYDCQPTQDEKCCNEGYALFVIDTDGDEDWEDEGEQAETDEEPIETKLGVFALFDPTKAEALGAKVVRAIVTDGQLRCAMEGGSIEESAFFQKLQAFKEMGIEVILTLRWPKEELACTEAGEMITNDADRVPTREEREEALALFEAFLEAVAPFIGGYQLQNEVFGGPGYYEEADISERDGIVPALDWLTTLAMKAEEIFEGMDAEGKLPEGVPRIISPALTFPDVMNDFDPNNCRELSPDYYLDERKAEFFRALMKLSRTHTDAIDLHLHIRSLTALHCILTFMKAQTDMPLTSLEFSPAKKYRDFQAGRFDCEAVGIESVPCVGGELENQCGEITNGEALECLVQEENNLTGEQWAAFIATLPYFPGHIPTQVGAMRQAGFLHACYAVGWQYGDPAYDWSALLANRVVGEDAKNETFYNAFLCLSTADGEACEKAGIEMK